MVKLIGVNGTTVYVSHDGIRYTAIFAGSELENCLVCEAFISSFGYAADATMLQTPKHLFS